MNSLDRYTLTRPAMLTGDVIEWRSRTIIGALIRARTGADVNHSSLVVNFDFDGCRQRRYVLEALNGGIELRLLSKRLERHHGEAYWSALDPRFDGYRSRLLGWALDKVGTEYDYGSLFKQLFASVSLNAERYFCSEFVQDAWECAEIIPRQDRAIQPGGFDDLGVLMRRVKLI